MPSNKQYVLINDSGKIRSYFSHCSGMGPIITVINEKDAKPFSAKEANIVAFNLNRGIKKWKVKPMKS